jgi:multiple sugar transport system permease protein
MLPLAKPAVIAISLFSFVANWNDFFRPLIFLTSPEKQPLTLMLVNFQGAFRTEWGQLMAATILVMLGPLIVFFFAQRAFIQGIVFTGIKG